MAINGRIPASQLSRIPGSGPYGSPKLRHDAARAYNALHNYALARWGISMELGEGVVGRAYRNYDRQVLAKRYYGRDAATPGTSNHGWGTTVDLQKRQQRWVIDQVGHLFGFSKRWSDASWEWWHIRYRPGSYAMVARWYLPTLRYGSHGPSVKRLQKILRSKGYKSVSATGYYGVATRKAVWRYQRKKGLSADGVTGPSTWRKLLA